MATATPADSPQAQIAVPPSATAPAATEAMNSLAPNEIHVKRRNNKVTAFDASKIAVALTKAFLAVEGGSAAASPRIHETVRELTHQVVDALTRRMPDGGTVHIEDIQDQVELALMRSGEHKVARAYVLYREEQAHKRAEERAASGEPAEEAHIVDITLADGSICIRRASQK